MQQCRSHQIIKDEVLVTKADSRTTQCAICHDENRKGLGNVPGLACPPQSDGRQNAARSAMPARTRKKSGADPAHFRKGDDLGVALAHALKDATA